MPMEQKDLRAALEAILFVSNEPVKVEELAESFGGDLQAGIVAQLEEIRRAFDENVFGFMLEQAAGGWRLSTRPEHDAVLRRYFSKKGENRLSLAALETLAIIAYRQPITAPEVSEIRGVSSTAVIRTLLERRMVRVSGRKNVVGSPFLYRTTREFLVHFGLNDIRDLPRLEEFGDLIGENINDDLVAAIAAAEPSGSASLAEATAAEIPFAEGEEPGADAMESAGGDEARAHPSTDDQDAADTANESQLESETGEPARE